jgi:hypothetical protein
MQKMLGAASKLQFVCSLYSYNVDWETYARGFSEGS